MIRRASPAIGARLKWRLHQYKGDFTPRLVRALLDQGDIAIDVGAGWGFYTWLLANAVGPGGVVYAIEPNPVSVRSLNALSRRCGNVSVYQLGLADRNAEGALHIPVISRRPIDALGTLSPPSTRSEVPYIEVSVRIARLDDLLPEHQPVAFIKCDVEGHELQVIRGATGTLRRCMPPLLIEIEQRHQDEAVPRIFDHLGKLGYSGYWFQRGDLKPLEEFDMHRNQLEVPNIEGTSLRAYLGADYTTDFLFVPSNTDTDELSQALQPMAT